MRVEMYELLHKLPGVIDLDCLKFHFRGSVVMTKGTALQRSSYITTEIIKKCEEKGSMC